MPSKFKSIIIPILILIVVVAVTVTIIQFISVGIDLIRDKLNLPIGNMPTNIQEASTPIQDVPPETLDTTSNIKDIKTRELIVKPYTPSQNVFADQETYNKESLRLMLNGEFDIAQLHIKGTVKESGDHFLILNYGVVSGILNATRLSPNSIDLDLTRSRGGIFTNSETIDVVVNLMGQTILAATRSGFLLKRQGTISVNLWDANLMPPTITRVLVAPFNEKGNFGGAVIDKLTFEYSCKDNSLCDVQICPTNKLFTQCLKDSFGIDAAKSWCERSKIEACKL